MPNWVTNKIEAPEHVIRAMLNGEGCVDFNVVATFTGPHGDWDGIYGDADKPLTPRLVEQAREEFDATVAALGGELVREADLVDEARKAA